MSKVLVVATSRKTRGGITSVVKAHEKGAQWHDFHCHWVQTHRDGPSWRKIGYLMRALIDYAMRLPFYDAVHIHFSNGTSLKRKLVFARLAKALHKKMLIHFHAFDPDMTIHGKDKAKYKQLFEMADCIIVLSNWWRDEVKKAFPNVNERISVLYNPCEDVIVNANRAKQNKVLYAGTVNARKGYADLIRAFANVAQKYPDWTLTIAGNGEIEQGKVLAESLGVANRVEFLGWVNGEEKVRAFSEASIFCLPSYAEGFPMAVLDAWAYGLPVITTPVGGIPDVAKDGENMLLFNPGDISALADCLDRMISDAGLRAGIARESERFAKGQFSIESINAQLGEIYTSLGKS